MYTHFGEGTILKAPLPLCEGISSTLKSRVRQREANTWLKWTLHKHLTKPKLVSLKAVAMPGPSTQPKTEATGIVQAVVRIHSRQSLQHMRQATIREGNALRPVNIPIEGAANMGGEEGREIVEYLVIQKWIRKGQEGVWKIWGTTQETTMQDVNRALEAKKAGKKASLKAK